MSLPQIPSRLATGLFVAACALCQVIMAGGDEKIVPHAPPDGALKPLLEGRETGTAGELLERNESTLNLTAESKGGDRKKKDQRDELLILLLQILRSPR